MKNAVQTSKRTYRVDRRQISFFKFILEGYDNVAVLTTLDSGKGIVQVTVAPGCKEVVDDIVDDLAHEFSITPVKNMVSYNK